MCIVLYVKWSLVFITLIVDHIIWYIFSSLLTLEPIREKQTAVNSPKQPLPAQTFTHIHSKTDHRLEFVCQKYLTTSQLFSHKLSKTAPLHLHTVTLELIAGLKQLLIFLAQFCHPQSPSTAVFQNQDTSTSPLPSCFSLWPKSMITVIMIKLQNIQWLWSPSSDPLLAIAKHNCHIKWTKLLFFSYRV